MNDSAFNYLRKIGFSNIEAPDYGDFTNKPKPIYRYYCSSTECRFKFSPFYKGRQTLKDQIFKLICSDYHSICKDCGKPLHSQRARKVIRRKLNE